ncbi:MAG: VCBS repeat-containing protein [Acidobacteria bacterium]|nr:VCBS repeat-containing protein [Acidobacteriota bacterium]
MRKLLVNGFAVIFVALALAAVGSITTKGQTASDGFMPTLNGTTFGVLHAQGRWTYAYGTFGTVNGTPRNYLARFQNSGALDMGYNPAANGFIQDMIVDGDNMIVVGSFTTIGGAASSGLARLNINGVNDGSITTTIGGGAGSLARQPDGKILVGGHFTTVGGTSRSYLVRLNPNGTVDTSFNPNLNQAVFGITVLSTGKILIKGQFTEVDGQPRPNFARLNADGSLDTGFMANQQLKGANWHTFAAAEQTDGKIVVVGRFTRIGDPNVVRNRVARLLPNGDGDASFNANLDEYATDVKIQPDGKLIVAGYFNNANGVQRGGLVRLNMDGSLDTSFAGNTTVAGTGGTFGISQIALLDSGAMFAAGSFTQINGTTGYTNLARLYPDGTVDVDTNVGFASTPAVALVSLPNGKTLAGGSFTTIGGVTRRGMARLNWNGTVDPTFADPNMNGWTYSLAVQKDGKYIAGGDFSTVGGTSRERLARINPNGTLDTSFTPTFSANAWVSEVVVQDDGKILIVGSFTSVNGTARPNIARLNANGTLDTAFAPSANSPVLAAAVAADGKIVIGGYFTTVNGTARTGIARLNANGTLDTSFTTSLGGNIEPYAHRIIFDRFGKILIGGAFGTVNSVTRTYIARLNGDGSLDSGFVPPTLDSIVFSIYVDLNRRVFVAGRWSTVNSIPRTGVIELGDNGAFANQFASSGANDVLATTLRSDGKMLFSGYFTSVSGASRAQFAAVRTGHGTGVRSFLTVNPDSIIWNRGSSEIEVNRVVFEHSTDGVNYTYLGEGVRQLYSDWAISVPDANRTGYIRARGINGDFSFHRSMYEVVRYGVKPVGSRAPFDLDGDGKTDISVFRPGPGQWWYLRSSDGGNRAFAFGSSTDTVVPADFTGDGKADPAFWRPSTGEWFVLRSEDSTFFGFPFGATGDIPSPADFDGDGRADAAVFRPSTSTWFVRRSSDGQVTITPFGVAGDKPVPADYDGDGKTDIAVFRPGSGQWWYLRSSDGANRAFAFGTSTDLAVPGDYTGDGKADIAYFRPSTGEWYVLRSEDSSFYAFPWGASGDLPAPGDYDGDGKLDAAVFRPSSSTWFINRSTQGTLIAPFGTTGDRPVPNAFVR